MSTAIGTVHLTKRFHRTSGYRDLLPFRKRHWVTAVEGVDLKVEKGEFFGLLGPNGAGKTTLIKLLCCLLLPDSGTARVFGNDILRQEQEVKKLVGLVNADERSFFWRLTGRENLEFYSSLYRLSGQQARKRIDELLSLVGLSDKGDIRFQNYSTGMRQKLAIARGFLNEPRVLFVDEPTRSLDPVSAQAIRCFLKRQVTEEGKTVVLATHNLKEAGDLCDRLAIMEGGRVVAAGSVAELRSRFQTQEVCELQVRHFPCAILPRLRLISGVSECQITSQYDGVSSLEIKMFDRPVVLPQILQTVVCGGAEVFDFHLKESSLDEIFSRALHSTDVEVRN